MIRSYQILANCERFTDKSFFKNPLILAIEFSMEIREKEKEEGKKEEEEEEEKEEEKEEEGMRKHPSVHLESNPILAILDTDRDRNSQVWKGILVFPEEAGEFHANDNAIRRRRPPLADEG
uniref:Uncharacterized protein n=1 Tax=Vespula pensylvanica TaxID=30213 RepID=A0A834K4N8_VESPE|nr:hypothetical protein H0235_015755 [Vespula pensylvanica]